MLTTSGVIVLIVGFLAFTATVAFSIMTVVLISFMKQREQKKD